MGKVGLEPTTSGLSVQHSNQLSYMPLENGIDELAKERFELSTFGL